ncbi:Nif3-like dinuclear metal center hexameric protein [Persicobacter diffluens]
MPKISDIIRAIEQFAPPALQESYDNAGLLVGDQKQEVTGVLICLDSTEDVVAEAIEKNCNLIVAHHPIIFGGLKRLTGSNYIQRTVIKAIKNDIAIYAAHTNLDNVKAGVNKVFAEKLGLENLKILSPKSRNLLKLTTFIPEEQEEEVTEAMHQAGAGQIGEYKNCSFRILGDGYFQPSENANPTIGEAGGEIEKVKEVRVEVIFDAHRKGVVIAALKNAHPYEEVAYYLHALENTNQETGSGMVGTLPKPMPMIDFLKKMKTDFRLGVIKHTALLDRPVKKVAVCGGSGSFLLRSAIGAGADLYITADFKYHEFFDAENRITIADIGHYESEVHTKEIFVEILSKNFLNIAVHVSQVNTNPVSYI